jgi:hypothetical protein
MLDRKKKKKKKKKKKNFVLKHANSVLLPYTVR